ncbi:MAG: hypothetical protein GY948_06415 [Alphaproteobacteria bacterium]|nr:hypothetical protein [Alphaproteobacteria bacterium]
MLVLLKSRGVRCLSGLALAFLCLALHSHPGAAQKRDGVLTGKEKLAGKATDDQRVNNCKVPAEKRGTKARPDKCGAKDASTLQKAE